jgi:hypothetical protein
VSEKFITRERVFFSASALAAAGLSAVAFKLIQRHREQEDVITLEGADRTFADQFAARITDASESPIDSDVAYVGIDDHEERAASASEVHVIGESRRFAQLRRRAMNGAVYIHDTLGKEKL